jgi:hypothetical protein
VINEANLDHFFGGLETRLEGAAEYSRHAARLIGSEFSVFRYITGELLLSDILADLLDPRWKPRSGRDLSIGVPPVG